MIKMMMCDDPRKSRPPQLVGHPYAKDNPAIAASLIEKMRWRQSLPR
jgi:hypothetical protein